MDNDTDSPAALSGTATSATAGSTGGTGSGPGSGPTKKQAASAQEALKRFVKIVNSFLARPDSGPFREPVDWRGLELYDYPEIIKKQMDLGTVKRKLERQQYPNAAAAAYDVRLVWKNCMTYNTEGSDFYVLAKGYSKRFEDRYRRIRNDFYVGDDPVFSDDEVEEPEEEEDEEDEPQSGEGDGEEDDDMNRLEMDDDDEEEEFDGKSEASGGTGTARGSTGSPASVGDTANKKQRLTSSSATSSSSPPIPNPKLDARAKLASHLLLLNGVHLGHVIHLLEKHCPQALESEPPTMPQRAEKLEVVIDKIEPPELFQQLSAYAAEHSLVRKRPNPNPKMKDVSNRRKDRK